MPLWKIPDISYLEFIRLSLTIRRDDSCADTAFQNVGSFGGNRVPMQFAEPAGIQAHRDPGDALRKREFSDRGLFGGTARPCPALSIFLDIEHEIVELLLLRFASARQVRRASAEFSFSVDSAAAAGVTLPRVRPLRATPKAAKGVPASNWRRLNPMGLPCSSDGSEAFGSELFIERSQAGVKRVGKESSNCVFLSER